MGVSMLDNISYKGQKPDNARSQFDTIDEMVAFSENYLPPIYVTLCAETGKQYMYQRSNAEDATLGKWREVTGGGSVDAYTKTETDALLDEKLSIEHDALDEGKVPVVGDDGDLALRKLTGADVSIEVDGNSASIQDSLNQANGLPVLDANGKILASQLPTSARKIVGYVDAENVHTLPDASTYDAGSELIVTSAGSITQSTAFTLAAGNKLTEMEASNANALITAGYVFTITDDGTSTSLGTVTDFDTEKLIFSDGTEVTLPYANDLSATSTPATVPVAVSVGDEFMVIDGHWVHLSNTSNVTSVNGKAGNVVLAGGDINVTIGGSPKSLQNAIEDGDIGGGSAEDVAYTNAEHTAWTNVKKALDGIINKVYYVKPSITSFVANPATTVYEIGQKVSSIAFTWATNKDITTQSLTDCTLADATVRTATYDTEISSNKTFTLTVGDGENTDTKTFSVAFRNKIYYGGATIPTDYDSAFILGLAKSQFATTYKGTYAMTIGSGEYGYIACPNSFSMPSECYIGGFLTTLEKVSTMSLTNASGGVVTYDIIKTGRSGLGSITMEVK